MIILVYDVHASESGALAILNDLYMQICNNEDKSIQWVFAVSTPEYEEMENIKVLRYPWVKKSWLHRLYFDNVTTRFILKQYAPDRIFSLQNEGIRYCKKSQCIYLHLPFILTDYKFNIMRDGKKLWLYQNVLSQHIFASLRKVDRTIVQTQWMKKALVEKAKIKPDTVIILPPDISTNNIGEYEDKSEHRKTFFYPATSFTYKNHITILKACNELQKKGINDYKVIFTIRPDENNYTHSLQQYVQEHNLNVDFRGMMPREKVFELYTKSVLIFPSFVESFGLPLLEARLSGTFILAINYSFSNEILNGYQNAQYFEQLDFKTLNNEMELIMNEKTKYYAIENAKNSDFKHLSLLDIALGNESKI